MIIVSKETHKRSKDTLQQGFFNKNLGLHIKSSNAVLKNHIQVAVRSELPDFSEKGYIYVATSINSISGCVSPIISYLYLPFLLLFTPLAY